MAKVLPLDLDTTKRHAARVGMGRLFMTVASRERDELQRAEDCEARQAARRPLSLALRREMERCLRAAKEYRGRRCVNCDKPTTDRYCSAYCKEVG